MREKTIKRLIKNGNIERKDVKNIHLLNLEDERYELLVITTKPTRYSFDTWKQLQRKLDDLVVELSWEELETLETNIYDHLLGQEISGYLLYFKETLQ